MAGPTMAPFESAGTVASPEALSIRLFDGALVVFESLDTVAHLTRRVREIVEETFETANPQRAEAALTPDDFRRRSTAARRRVADDETTDRLWQRALSEAGYPAGECYIDRIRLRVVPSRSEIHGRIIRPLPAHRDSWASGISAQINWWMPLYPLAATRTMLIWPHAFRLPVANDSGSWDFAELITGQNKGYPMLPTAETPAEPGKPVIIDPGELLAFSAAHLHASVSDGTGMTRFSLDTRTTWLGDVSAGRGAPNVDGAASISHWEWFTPPAIGDPARETAARNRHSEGAS